MASLPKKKTIKRNKKIFLESVTKTHEKQNENDKTKSQIDWLK